MKYQLPISLLSFDHSKGNVLIVYTGGTFGMVKNLKTDTLEPYNLSNLIDYFPDLNKLNVNISLIECRYIVDSSNITADNWIDLVEIIEANYHRFDGFIIIHGTDTMAYSASALSFLIENLSKPIIFTGAQLPVSMLRSDARDNLISAIEIATLRNGDGPKLTEVAIYFNNVLLRGNRSTKVESAHFDAFESPQYPILAETGINIDFQEEYLMVPKIDQTCFYKKIESEIALVKLFPSISKNFLESVFNSPNIKGIVLETFGSGNAPTYDWFLSLLQEAVNRGVVILNVSQCFKGVVLPNIYETGNKMYKIGVIPGMDLTVEAAITKLMFLLGKSKDIEFVKSKLQIAICGEMNG